MNLNILKNHDNEKLVSIVLPVYNGEKYLSKSIESVLSQTYINIELIIVNDCSTDSTESIINEYKKIDKRVKYIKNKENYKLPRSLNIGFELAKGEYFTWTSDDNMYHSDAIQIMVTYLNENIETGMVSYGYNVIDEEGNFIYTHLKQDNDDLLFGNNIGACFLYRAEIARRIGKYREDLFLIEDYDYWLRISRDSRIDYCNVILYEYRVHQKSLTVERKEQIRSILEKYQWGMLAEYERIPLEEDQLFHFFDYLLSFKKNRMHRLFLILKFVIKYPRFVKYKTKQIRC